MHTTYSEFEFDPSKAEENLRKHAIDFKYAEEALSDPSATTLEDASSLDEQRFLTLGCDRYGRVLLVVHTARGRLTRIISARKASKQEVKKYYGQRI